jgi:hypothetical protein
MFKGKFQSETIRNGKGKSVKPSSSRFLPSFLSMTVKGCPRRLAVPL